MKMRGSFCHSKACNSDSIIKISMTDIPLDYAKLVTACARLTAIREHKKSSCIKFGDFSGEYFLELQKCCDFYVC